MSAMPAERDDAVEAEEPWLLPHGWESAPLARFLANGQITVDPRREPQRTFVLYSVPSFEKRMPDRVRGAEIFSPKRKVEPESVLLCKINPRINRAWVVSDHQGEEIIASPEWITFPNNAVLEPHYLRYFLSTERVRQHLSQNVSGVGGSLMRVNGSTIGEIVMPIAPLSEQRRIVARIDELFAEIAEGEAALERARSGLDTWRRALLKAAVTGELTRDWRESNRGTESGTQLAERIRASLESKAKRRRGTKKLDAGGPTSRPLPEGWTWVTWGEVGLSQNGRAFPSNEYAESGTKLLRPGNLFSDGSVRWTSKNTRYLPSKFEDENPDLIIKEKELVINLTAQSLRDEFLGRVCLTSEGEHCLLNQRLARLTPFIISPEFILIVFKSPIFREFVSDLNTGSLIQHMFTSQMERFAFPLPPEDEQLAIRTTMEVALSVIADTEKTISDGLADTKALRQSILKSAFEGRLVRQNPSDEPASALLARLHAEVSSAPRRRGRKPAS